MLGENDKWYFIGCLIFNEQNYAVNLVNGWTLKHKQTEKDVYQSLYINRITLLINELQ